MITEIPPLGNGLVFMQDINDDGVAVGSAQISAAATTPFRHTDLGGVQDLGALPGFGAQSFATAIAPDGAIGGHADHGDGTGALFGYRYTPAGGHRRLCPGGCSVWDLNGSGQVVGLLLGREATTWQAFLWSPASGLHPLGTLGGTRSSASGISESGLVVGNAQVAGAALDDVGHAFLYDSRAAHPALQDLNTRAKTSGWVLRGANDVNDAFVVGYGLHDGQSHAFRMSLGDRPGRRPRHARRRPERWLGGRPGRRRRRLGRQGRPHQRRGRLRRRPRRPARAQRLRRSLWGLGAAAGERHQQPRRDRRDGDSSGGSRRVQAHVAALRASRPPTPSLPRTSW